MGIESFYNSPTKNYVRNSRQYEITPEKVYDAVFYVATVSDGGNDSTGLPNEYFKPYSTINTAWFQAFLYKLNTGKNPYVHVRAGIYNELINNYRDKVDLYFENYAIVLSSAAFPLGVIGSFQTNSVKFDILGKGSFINSLGTLGASGISLTNGIHNFNIQAKEVSSLTVFQDFNYTRINNEFNIDNIYGSFAVNKRTPEPISNVDGLLKFINSKFPKGFQYGRNFGGFDIECINCTFIIEPTNDYIILDKDGNTVISVINNDNYNTTSLTSQQVLDNLSDSAFNMASQKAGAFELRPSTTFGAGNSYNNNKLLLQDCIYIIRKENCFGFINFNRSNSSNTSDKGRIIIRGGQVYDETLGQNGVAFSSCVLPTVSTPKRYYEKIDYFDTNIKYLSRSGYIPLFNIGDEFIESNEILDISTFTDNIPGIVNTSYIRKELLLNIEKSNGNNTQIYVYSSNSPNINRGGRIDRDSNLSIPVMTDDNGEFNLMSSDVLNTIVTIHKIK